ncbi:FAD-dependent oxidoreductase [Raoultibacter timonensis]|uniref:FAD-binding dehydrogenase n=1 Tax=Raoultibacter timonensis TaxID=1907662 RepID=A0ABN6MGB7_9ACTN|nr:FAD-dependent oxidoreductase [Raoultibacter timonensis]BDE97030.1 FAD-binding dehydrogenase [Raoultibacter timonensis]BDF51634.1 FAD-binding dehydrogenase [Raoultibacter timonensis]
MKTSMNRRSFLAGAGMAGLALAGASAITLAGCSNAMGAGDAADGSSAAPVEHNPVETLDCDVVVVGSGTAGICAALSAAENGAKVIVLEKNGALYGSSVFAEGVGAIGSRLQKELGVEIDPQEMMDKSVLYHHWACNQVVLRKFLDECGPTIDWLETHGATFYDLFKIAGSAPTWLLPNEGGRLTGGVGKYMLPPLEDSARAMGVEFRISSPATELLIEDGAVKGIYAETENGEILINTAKGVILATGGYGNNAEMFKEFSHNDLDGYVFWGSEGHDGNGISMGVAAGGALHHPEAVMNSLLAPPSSFSYETPVAVAFGQSCNFQVNESGARFWNENSTGDFTFLGNTALAQEKIVSIVTETELLDVQENGLFVLVAGGVMGPFPTLVDDVAADPDITKFDTLDEIAEFYGIDADGLKASVERYNGFADAGIDEEFGKDPSLLHRVEPPFYTSLLLPSFYTTVGGLKVTPDMQVVAEGGGVIPGLFAVGCDAAGIYGFDYDVGTMTGSQQGWCATGGRLAGAKIIE